MRDVEEVPPARSAGTAQACCLKIEIENNCKGSPYESPKMKTRRLREARS